MSSVETSLVTVVAAFETTFQITSRPFGSPNSRWRGASDDAKGVQWNAGVDRDQGSAYVGVNLEGMKYDGWPITRLIERELAHPTLLQMRDLHPDTALVSLTWSRDAWQASARLPIDEREIGGGPILLADLTTEMWLAMLREAYTCLDPERNHRGRVLQTVTLKRGPIKRWVSPHLHFACTLWQGPTPKAPDAEALMARGAKVLKPVYEFVRDRSR